MTEQPEKQARWRVSRVQIAGSAVVVLAVAALVVAVTRAPAAAGSVPPQCNGSTPKMTVQGSGDASGSPDALDVQAQVSVDASSAQSAMAQDDATTSAVVQAVEAAGVPAKDIQTTDLTINPDYATTDGRTVITGYNVTNSLDITVHKLGGAGSVIDGATTAGGDALSISSLNFERYDPRSLENQARRDAVHQAVTHAGAMARAAGQRLGAVCSITDDSSVYAAPQPLSLGVEKAAAASVPLEGGTQQANAQVTVVYALEPLGG